MTIPCLFSGHRHSEQVGPSSPSSRQGSISLLPYAALSAFGGPQSQSAAGAASNQNSVGGSGGWAAQQAANAAAAAAEAVGATEEELGRRIDTIGQQLNQLERTVSRDISAILTILQHSPGSSQQQQQQSLEQEQQQQSLPALPPPASSVGGGGGPSSLPPSNQVLTQPPSSSSSQPPPPRQKGGGEPVPSDQPPPPLTQGAAAAAALSAAGEPPQRSTSHPTDITQVGPLTNLKYKTCRYNRRRAVIHVGKTSSKRDASNTELFKIKPQYTVSSSLLIYSTVLYCRAFLRL